MWVMSARQKRQHTCISNPLKALSILLRNELIEHPVSRSDTATFRKLNHMHSAPETAYHYPPCSTDRTVLETVRRLKTLDAKGCMVLWEAGSKSTRIGIICTHQNHQNGHSPCKEDFCVFAAMIVIKV